MGVDSSLQSPECLLQHVHVGTGGWVLLVADHQSSTVVLQRRDREKICGDQAGEKLVESSPGEARLGSSGEEGEVTGRDDVGEVGRCKAGPEDQERLQDRVGERLWLGDSEAEDPVQGESLQSVSSPYKEK